MGIAAPVSQQPLHFTYAGWDPAPVASRSPGEVRELVLVQHERIRALLKRLGSRATRLLATPVPAASECEATRRSALALCGVMSWHIDCENRVLLPLLDETDPLRAAHMRADHEEQLLALRAYATALEQPSSSSATLALIAWQLVDVISEDMQLEEASLRDTGSLWDDAC